MKTKSPSQFGNRRLNNEQWQDIMSNYEQNGLTQEAFCVRESLAPNTFYTWRQRLGGVKQSKSKISKKPMFLELTPPQKEQGSTDWDIELRLGENIVLRLRQLS